MIFPLLVALSIAAAPAGPDPAEAAARAWMATPPAALAERLEREPALVPQALGALGQALGAADRTLSHEAGEYLIQCSRGRSGALARRGTWSPADVQALLTLDLVTPGRFVADAGFRSAFSPCCLAIWILPVRRACGTTFSSRSIRLKGSTSRRPRRSKAPGAPCHGRARRGGAVRGRPAVRRRGGEALERVGLLAAVRLLRHCGGGVLPLRGPPGGAQAHLLVLTDLPLRRALESRARGLGIHLLETYGRGYSPWPRDPFSLVRTPAGGVLVLVRP